MGFTAMNRGQRGKLAMATAALGIGLLSVTGCGYINPQQTTDAVLGIGRNSGRRRPAAAAQHDDHLPAARTSPAA